MSDESPVQTRLTTDVPLASGSHENYVLLLVLLCVFAGGTLIILSVLLVFCHRCCRGGRRYSRASDDLEKTNTTYIEESQPTHDVALRLESGESLSTSSCHGDADVEHFLSASCTGRRVSFNESAIYEQSAKDPEKGRRYTLTEGDFHHLKKARLTNLHMPPPALKILTIMECDSPENSVTLSQQPSTHPTLAIFQASDSSVPEAAGLWSAPNSSCALPGDSLNSSLNTSAEHTNKPTRSQTVEVMSRSLLMDRDSVFCPAAGQGTMFHLLSKLRRHASLEGAGPLFSVKKWRLDTIQRAASLDMRGSPRRRAFQRQRAASETLDQGEEILQSGAGDFLLRTPSVQPQTELPRRLSAGSLDATSGAPSALSRLEVEAVMELRNNTDAETQVMTPVCPSLHASLDMEDGEEDRGEMMDGASGGGGEEFGAVSQQEQPSLYRDIWSLRASLEQYASSDLSSNDRDSTRSDADSVCSVGASRTGVPSYQSQDIDDDMDGDGELPYDDAVAQRRNGRESMDSERGSDGETNNRKLLQMDSGYASIEAPCKAPEDFRLFGSGSGKTASERRRFFTNSGRKGTVCESFEARLFKEELEDEASAVEPQPSTKPRPRFRRRDYSIDEKTEALFNEFLRHDPQFDQQGSPSLRHRHRSRIHLRKQWQRSKQYSDPGAARYSPSLERQRCFPLRRGDSANYPLDTRYHSTLPRIASAADEEASEGAAGTESPEPEKAREESGNATPPLDEPRSGPDLEENANNSSNNTNRHFFSFKPQDNTTDPHKHSPTDHGAPMISSHRETVTADQGSDYMRHSLTNDKLVSTLDSRLYSNLRTQGGNQECVVTVSRTSPDLEE